MKNYIPVFAFVSLLSFVSCSNKEAGGNTASSNESTQDTSLSLFHAIPVDSIVSPIAGVRVMSYSAEHIDSTFLVKFKNATDQEREDWPGFAPQDPNKIEIQFLQFEANSNQAVWKKINDTIRYLVMGHSSAAKTLLYQDSDFLSSIYSQSSNMTIDEWTHDYLSIVQNDGGYMGGAHGFYGAVLNSFDLKTGERMTYKNVFREGTLEAVAKTVQAYYEKEYGISYKSMSEKFELANCFAFEKKGITFLYNPYEMGSYADGVRELTVPYAALKDFINPAYIGLK